MRKREYETVPHVGLAVLCIFSSSLMHVDTETSEMWLNVSLIRSDPKAWDHTCSIICDLIAHNTIECQV